MLESGIDDFVEWFLIRVECYRLRMWIVRSNVGHDAD